MDQLFGGPGKKGGLEDLASLLSSQIKESDWLEKNTAEQWKEENKETYEELKKVQEKKEDEEKKEEKKE